MSLMLNAIEAMKWTGRAHTVKSQREDGHIVVSASDTGVGLTADPAFQLHTAAESALPSAEQRQP